MKFMISHIFRQDNHWADRQANFGVDNKLYFKWFTVDIS